MVLKQAQEMLMTSFQKNFDYNLCKQQYEQFFIQNGKFPKSRHDTPTQCKSETLTWFMNRIDIDEFKLFFEKQHPEMELVK